MLLSPDAERPPSRLLAYTRARYEISDLREIYDAGTRNSARSSGGYFSGGGPQSAPFWYTRYTTINSTLNYASAGPVYRVRKKTKIKITYIPVDTPTNRSTHPHPCTTAVQQYVVQQ